MLIKQYTPKWIQKFLDLKHEIEKGLIRTEYRIEHVGSTSVPLLDAKDIIDIVVIYRIPSDFDKIKSGLMGIGYYHNGDQGIEGREVFKRTGALVNEILDSITHHLYVCHIESIALERHILFRNYLRKNEWARLKYQRMKYDLAVMANQNKSRYAVLKALQVNGFIDSIIELEKAMTSEQ